MGLKDELSKLARTVRGIFPSNLPTGLPVDWETAGPEIEDHPLVDWAASPTRGEFVDGYWTAARKMPAHSGRVGGEIDPFGAVWHTTDMLPDTFEALVKAWAASAGKGNAANFLIDRNPPKTDAKGNVKGGVVQMIPIHRNGNHAGGSVQTGRGRLVTTTGKDLHPNVCFTGIEVHNAGRLTWDARKKQWIYRSWNATAKRWDNVTVIPDGDVYVSSSGIGYHKVTEYQWDVMNRLCDALDRELREPPHGIRIVPNGTYAMNQAKWASDWPSLRGVPHATLDPRNKTDCGEEIALWLRQRLA